MNLKLANSLSLFLLFGILISCGPQEKLKSVSSDIQLTGSMLFEGSNTLQGDASNQLSDLLKKSELSESKLTRVKVTSVEITVSEETKELFESFLFQIVSDNNDLMTIGTLSPLPDATSFSLSLAEDTEVIEYLKDNGATWVLDANFSEDYMDDLLVTCQVEYDLY